MDFVTTHAPAKTRQLRMKWFQILSWHFAIFLVLINKYIRSEQVLAATGARPKNGLSDRQIFHHLATFFAVGSILSLRRIYMLTASLQEFHAKKLLKNVRIIFEASNTIECKQILLIIIRFICTSKKHIYIRKQNGEMYIM